MIDESSALLNYSGRLLRRFRGSLAVGALSVACAGAESLTPPPGSPNVDLRIQKATSHSTREVGQQVTFTVTVRNLGAAAATGILAGDTLPVGLTHVSSSATIGTYSAASGVWNIGSLALNQDAVLTLIASVNAGTVGQTLVNQAGVLSTQMNDTVPANNIAQASVTVAAAPPPPPPPPPAGVFFESNWGTATGSSDNAIGDGGRWGSMYCGGRANTLTVVSGASVGFSMSPNVLRLQDLGPSVCGMLEARNAIPLSTSHYGRMYFRNDETQTQHNHVMTYFPVGTIQLAAWNRSGFAGGVRIFMRTYYYGNGSGAVYPTNLWRITTLLQHATWYRYEWFMEYVTPTTYRIWPRIYNMSGELLFDATTYFQNDASASSGLSLTAYYASGGTFGFSDVTLARNFGIGNEGPAGASNSGGFWYHARIALSTSGWIGQ